MRDDYRRRMLELLAPPRDVAAAPWDEIAGEGDLSLPSDYKWFCDTYGGGNISRREGLESGAWLEISSPSRAAPSGLSTGINGLIEYHMRDFHDEFTYDGSAHEMWADDPRPVFPERGGVFAWGQSEWGDSLFWLTADPNPDNWPVIAWMRHGGEPIYPGCGMVEFLIRMFQGEFKWMTSWIAPGLQWTMQHDWLRSGLENTSGPTLG